MKIRKMDILLIFLLLLISLILMAFRGAFSGLQQEETEKTELENTRKSTEKVVVVRSEGKIIGTYSLSEEKRVEVENSSGGKNSFMIEMGDVHMEEASCPDKLCVKQGTVNREGELIVCLPNELVLEIVNTEEEALDAVVR